MIWKKILLKNIEGYKFKNCKTISDEDKKHKFQIFEVLITETLAVIEPFIHWQSLPVSKDNGIDFVGKKTEMKTPYILDNPTQIILGQIKRRANGYRKDDLRYDIIKVVDYYNSNYSYKTVLFDIIHVLSTDKNIDISSWMDNMLFPHTHYHVTPINAIDFFRFWKINNEFFLRIIDGVCTYEQAAILLNYINNLDSNWQNLISTSISIPQHGYLGEEFEVILSLKSHVELSLNIYIEWEANNQDENCNVALIYPHNMVKNNAVKYHQNLYNHKNICIKMKVYQSGTFDLGQITLFSESGDIIEKIVLGEINILPGIATTFYEKPCSDLLMKFKQGIMSKDALQIHFWAITGQGGIGKTSLSNELRLFAMNNGYYTISLQNSNDIIDNRRLIFDLFINLILKEQTDIYAYEKLFELISDYMGVNFKKQWIDSLMKYVLYEQDVYLEHIVECIVSLLIIASAKTPLFIWLSDMHWASKETIELLKSVISNIKLNGTYFSNSVIFIFEGRDSETLITENKTIYPLEWLKFIESDKLKRFQLGIWDESFSDEFVEMLINPYGKENQITERKQELKKFVLDNAGGNPMHMKEYLRFGVDNGSIEVRSDGSLDLIDINDLKQGENLSIKSLIISRIKFLHSKYPEIIDYYIILATISSNRLSLYNYMKKMMDERFFDYLSVEQEISIIKSTHGDIKFVHEHYKEMLQKERIKDYKLLESITKYFDSQLKDTLNDIDCLDSILLKTLHTDCDYIKIYDETMRLIGSSKSDSIILKSYEILLSIPARFRKTVNISEVYFNMSEITTRISSWNSSEKYLLEIIHRQPENELDILCNILAHKNLANIYGVTMRLEQALNICNNGLSILTDIIEEFQDKEIPLKEEFFRQKEMLLNRLAVLYWFIGQCYNSDSYQQEALLLAKKRGDIYSIAHTLYETGMRQLHEDIYLGTDNINKALKLLPKKSRFTEPQERVLVETEMLIGKLLIFAETRNNRLLAYIKDKSRNICNQLKIGNVNYESAICHIINGICHIFCDNLQEALRSFYISADCSNLGNCINMLWKAYLNISQVHCMIHTKTGNKLELEQAQKYAEKSKIIILQSIENNPNISTFRDLMSSPLNQIQKILDTNEEIIISHNTQQTIHIAFDEYRFYIMD